MKNRNGIFWGLFMLLSAGILVVSQMHLITYTFTFWTIVATIFLVAILIKSLVYFSVPGTVFSLAFMAILYAKPLGITAIVPWTLLGAALLVSIGLSMILNPLLAKHRPWGKYHHNNWHGHAHNYRFHHGFDGEVDVDNIDIPDVEVNVKMGSSVRYVTSDFFREANINVSMGNAKVYFENVKIEDSAVINIDVSLGSVELYLPSHWNVVKELDNNNLSGIDDVGPIMVSKDAPTVTLVGQATLSGITIHRI